MSQFLKQTGDYMTEPATGIDFDDVIKLPAGGSTCDIYRTRWQRREVFVKRLKKEFRANPLYLDALDKEFEIGVKLKHRSLPDYREFHREYIVMDYIDGITLAQMIRNKDPWLAKEKNIRKLLKELVEVVDYLHMHNVVHCDIKPDNIMITSDNRNLILIDFDKSYTDALNDTSGHPGTYGLSVDEAGRGTIDFHGIGLVTESIKACVPKFKFAGYKRFVKACYRSDVNCQDLNEILDTRHHPFAAKIFLAVSAVIAIGILFTAAYLINKPASEAMIDNNVDTVLNDTVQTAITGANIEKTHTPATGKLTPETPKGTDVRLHAEPENLMAIDNIDSPQHILDKRVKPYFDTMIEGLNRLDSLRKNKLLSSAELRKHWEEYQKIESENFEHLLPVIADFEEQNPELRHAHTINSTGSCMAYMKRATSVKEKYLAEIERRPD